MKDRARPEVLFAKTSDGVRIAYSMAGEGPVLVYVQLVALLDHVVGRELTVREGRHQAPVEFLRLVEPDRLGRIPVQDHRRVVQLHVPLDVARVEGPDGPLHHFELFAHPSTPLFSNDWSVGMRPTTH